jgi:hypothetical protein
MNAPSTIDKNKKVLYVMATSMSYRPSARHDRQECAKIGNKGSYRPDGAKRLTQNETATEIAYSPALTTLIPRLSLTLLVSYSLSFIIVGDPGSRLTCPSCPRPSLWLRSHSDWAV